MKDHDRGAVASVLPVGLPVGVERGGCGVGVVVTHCWALRDQAFLVTGTVLRGPLGPERRGT